MASLRRNRRICMSLMCNTYTHMCTSVHTVNQLKSSGK
jgi:hypothetical protein